MLATDDLFHLALHLERSPEGVKCLREALDNTYASSEYKNWFGADQYSGAQFSVHDSRYIKIFNNDNLPFSLLDNSRLKIKINKHEDRILITDGLWVDGSIRVFPFTDESERLYEYATEAKLFDWADIVIDPATGSGSHLIAAPTHLNKIAFDISPRAILFSSINRRLNNLPSYLIGRNDIADGIPPEIIQSTQGNVLFLVNMPFAVVSMENVLPISADGGRTGAKWTFAALKAIYDFSKANTRRQEGRAVVLCYSVGNQKDDRWEVFEKAKTYFGDNVSWRLLTEEKLWRIKGKKEQPNPMNLEKGLPLRASCPFYVRDKDRERVRVGYDNLAISFNQAGWDVLGYGIIDIRFCGW